MFKFIVKRIFEVILMMLVLIIIFFFFMCYVLGNLFFLECFLLLEVMVNINVKYGLDKFVFE